MNPNLKLNNLPLAEIGQRMTNKNAAMLALISRIARNSTKKNMNARKNKMKQLANLINAKKENVKYLMLNANFNNNNKNNRINFMLNTTNKYFESEGLSLTERQLAIIKLAFIEHAIALVSEELTFPWNAPNTVNRLMKGYSISKYSAEKMIMNLRISGEKIARKVESNSNSLNQLKNKINGKLSTLHNYMQKLYS